MIQKKFLCKDLRTTEEAIGSIGRILSESVHKSALLVIYEKGFTKEETASLVRLAEGLGHDELMIAGISLTLIAELMPEGTGALLNLILTEEADIEVVSVPCAKGGETEAADKLRKRLDAHSCVKAVELFGSNMALNTTRFMERAMEGHEDAVLFGTSTIRGLDKKISVDEGENKIDVEQTEVASSPYEFVIGSDIMLDGFVAIIFAGPNLHVQSDYALGWKPIGRRLPIELGKDPAKGETVVTSINGIPAVDIYREYLGVYPDSFFISNICEFPFVVERDGIDICLIPLEFGPDGELYIMMTLGADETLRFTFASHDEVLYASRESLEKMEAFCPEALFLTLCGNRINFLKEDAHIEWDEFGKVRPEFALMHGSCELLYHNKKGGILNSAHLAVGMREGTASSGREAHDHPTLESLRKGRTLSLSDRMSTFLSKITNELIDIASEARDANNAKSAFLSHMSHEIRTPINVILGMDEMILQESKEEEVLDYAEGIRASGNNLLGLVNDILDFSKIEAGKMSIIPVEYELKTLIYNLYNVVRLRSEDKNLTVKFDIDQSLPSVLFGDEKRIKQVITNMMTNAVKYTEKGGITLSIGIADDEADHEAEYIKACPGDDRPEKAIRIRVSVRDTGIGIKPEDMEKLFVEYERFDEKRNRKVEGTGLGLSITTELLELMGSRLSVESTYGKGSEFGFEIMQGVSDATPAGELDNTYRRSASTGNQTGFTAENAKMLIVDDSSINLIVIVKLLARTKIGIDTATSGPEAIEMVRQNEYDAILLDHMMPDMDGIETLQKMKEMTDNRSAGKPVIALSANALTGAREEYLSYGFTDYLSKPININELEDMMMRYLPPSTIKMTE